MLKCPDCQHELTDKKSCPCGWKASRQERPVFIRTCCRCYKSIGDGEYYRILSQSQHAICEKCLHPFEQDWRDTLVDDYMKNNPIGVTHSRIEHDAFMEIVKSFSITQDRKREEERRREKQSKPDYDEYELLNALPKAISFSDLEEPLRAEK